MHFCAPAASCPTMLEQWILMAHNTADLPPVAGNISNRAKPGPPFFLIAFFTCKLPNSVFALAEVFSVYLSSLSAKNQTWHWFYKSLHFDPRWKEHLKCKADLLKMRPGITPLLYLTSDLPHGKKIN